jgi:hypothetical protein
MPKANWIVDGQRLDGSKSTAHVTEDSRHLSN